MAIAIERKINTLGLSISLEGLKKIIRLKRDEVVSQKEIWRAVTDSGPTAGALFMFQAATDCSITPEQNPAVGFWARESKQIARDILHNKPQGWKLYRMLRQNNELTIDIPQSPVEKLQELIWDISSKAKQIREKLLKGGVL